MSWPRPAPPEQAHAFHPSHAGHGCKLLLPLGLHVRISPPPLNRCGPGAGLDRCIVTLMGAVMDGPGRSGPMLVMEFMSNGSLYDVLQARRGGDRATPPLLFPQPPYTLRPARPVSHFSFLLFLVLALPGHGANPPRKADDGFRISAKPPLLSPISLTALPSFAHATAELDGNAGRGGGQADPR